MSLMERAAAANWREEDDCPAAFNSLESLKEGVSRLIPAPQAAQMIAERPSQAKSELRAACERVLKDEPWLLSGGVSAKSLIEQYLDEVFGLGLLEDLLADEEVTEIMVNGSSSLYCERNGRLEVAGRAFANDAQVYTLIDRIIGPLGRRVDESSPLVNARLKQGHRVNAIIPPLALDGPAVTIRKFRSHAFTLADMRKLGSFDQIVEQLLIWAVLRRCNIAVSGGTGSGKTTLLNALSAVIPHAERIVTIEDSAELRFSEHPHVVRLEARPPNAEGTGEITIRELVVNSLRMRPDRIVVGECRGAEALDMLQAMSTGHDGSLTTLHANSPTEAISRLSTMVRYGSDLPVEVIETQIANAIDVVVQTTRYPDGSRGICEVAGYRAIRGSNPCKVERYFVRDFVSGECAWQKIPEWVDELSSLGIATPQEVELWKQATHC